MTGELSACPARRTASASASKSTILIITEFYYPDPAIGQRMHELLSGFVAHGHRITVFASRNRYLDKGASTAGGQMDPVRVVRLGSPFATGQNILLKAAAAWGFLLHAFARAAISREQFDVLITFSTPPMGHVFANGVAYWKGAKSIFWCADLHPESAIRLGFLRERSVLARGLRWLNRTALKRCDAIVAVGRCMKYLLENCGAPAERVFVIPMWHREALADPVSEEEIKQLRASLGLNPDTFVVMYSGNLGRVHIVRDILEAAARLSDRKIVFLLSAAGIGMREVEKAQQQHYLPNIVTKPLFPEQELRAALALADVHVLSLRPELCGVSVPGKLYGVMAVGRPAVFIGPSGSEAATTIAECQCGYQVTPGDTAKLVRILSELNDNPALRQQMGSRARAAFLTRFSAGVCCDQWQSILAGLEQPGLPTHH